jgi:uncharacterized membrane protein
LAFSLALRLINLNQSLWIDEAVQAITSQGPFSAIFAELQGDFHPPLYHFLMWFWVHIFGSGEVSLRLPSVFFGVGTVWMIYKLGNLGKLGSLGWVAALFLATAPFHIYYSQEARMYAMTAFFACLSMYFLLRVIRENGGNKGMILGYLTGTLAMLYSDYYGFLVLLAQMVAAGVFLRAKIATLLHCYVAILLLFLPWLPFFFVQLKTGLLATKNLPNWSDLVNASFLKALPLTFIKFSLGRITIFNKVLYGLVSLGVFGVLGLIGGVGGYRWYKQKGRGDFYLVILLWLIVPILIAWFGSLVIPNYQPFRLLLVLPAFYLLLAYGISRITTPVIYIIGVIAILVVNLGSTAVYFKDPYFYREDWRSAVGFIESQPDSLAILPSETSNWPWRYYSENKVKLVSVSREVKKVEEGEIFNNLTIEQFNNVTMIFYIRYLVPLFDPSELIRQRLEESGYVKIREVSFNQIPIWIYQNENRH